jgi:transposase
MRPRSRKTGYHKRSINPVRPSRSNDLLVWRSGKETRLCIVDDAGKIVREARVASEPEALLQVLTIYRFKRIGLEAGPLSQWLVSALAEAGLPVICVETHMQAVLKAQINKPQRCARHSADDARGFIVRCM